MNLELIEEKCVNYLDQVTNPIVPVATLLEHVRQDEACAAITQNELLEFLRGNHAFLVVERGDEEQDPEEAAGLREIGFVPGPRVLLKKRAPTKEELAGLIQQQLERMNAALHQGLKGATREGDAEAVAKIREILARADQLRDHIDDIL